MGKSVGVGHGAGRCVCVVGVNLLRWFSRGASVGGANVKLCICAVWGSSGRPVVSGGIPSYVYKPAVGTGRARPGTIVVSSGVVGYPLSR